ncbi:MAG: ROK family protein [Clostridiales bacterium]|nr:ROK family protein [Clostridiales bacterium]
MAKSGQNVSDIKNANRSLLLNILYYDGAQSRKALAQKSNLTPAAITGLMAELIVEGAVVETDKVTTEGRLGRSEQLIDINYLSLYVIGIRFETESFETSLVRLDSKMTAKKITELPFCPLDRITFGKMVSATVQDIITESAVDVAQVVGVGVTVSGIVDSEHGASIDSYGILEKDLNIVSELMKTLTFPIAVENNVRSMLRSDSILRHAKPLQSTLFIRYGPGVGAALLVGQKNFIGSNYRAVELGHISVEAGGDKCVCGKRGCLETVVSYEAIVKNAKKIFSAEQAPVLFESCNGDINNLTLEQILSAYEKEDVGVNHLMKSVVVRFAMAVANSAVLLDPERVLLASGIFTIEKFAKQLQNAISFFSDQHKPRYLMIANSSKLDKRGAACVAIHAFLATGAKTLRDNKVK